MDCSILVVEAEASARQLLTSNLQNSGYKVLCAGDVDQAESVMRAIRPDLVLLDWALPGIPGLTFTWRLRRDQRTRDIPVVLLSGSTEEQDKVAALEGGADDYVTKPYSLRELLARIKAVIRRRMPQLADDVVEVGGLLLDPVARVVRAGDCEIDLWTTEFRLLQFFMTHPGRIWSRPKLLDEIWGHDALVEERTVDVHIRRLRKALAPTGRDVLIETERGSGYGFRMSAADGRAGKAAAIMPSKQEGKPPAASGGVALPIVPYRVNT